MIIDYTFIIASALTGLLFSIIFQKLFVKQKLIDNINFRSSHKSTATRSGGLSIFITLFIITSYLYLSSNEIFDFSLLIPLSILFFIGIYDDVYNTDFMLKFIFQLIAAKILVDQGILVDNFHGFMGIYEIPYLVAQPFTIFFILTILNSYNFIDGIDGLALCQLFVTSMFALFLMNFGISWINVFLMIILGSSISLFYFNFRKEKKIFLGDGGSLLVGGIIAIILISTIEYNIYDLDFFSVIFICYLYPLIDIVRIVSIRIINKRSPFKADNYHIHHKLLKKLKLHTTTTFTIILISVTLQIIILLISTSR